MKVFKTKETSDHFQPLGVTIVFESAQDLTNLWYRLNYSVHQAGGQATNQTQSIIPLGDINDSSNDLWDLIDDIKNARDIHTFTP